MDLKIIKSNQLKEKPAQDKLGFGKKFTDHMFIMDYETGIGWHDPRIVPFGPFTVSPATSVFHYAQAIFEGLKAYKNPKGEIVLFRADENFKRMNRSAKRMCIPEFDGDFVLNSLKELIKIDKDWVPSKEGTSLYIRPAIIATDEYVGIKASDHYRFFIIMCPVGAYYSAGFDPVKIWVTKDYVRSVPGGVGEAKTAGNYAASLYASEEAAKKGYNQVLWLDGIEKKYVEEVGSMNIFFVIDKEIITPKLTGSILPGITRDSVIEMAKKEGYKVREERIAIDDVIKAHKNGKLDEVFGSGTAAVISPVGEIAYGDEKIVVGDGKTGKISAKFFENLTGIQYGKKEDPFNWMIKVC
ncbi:MAG: branched-chain amino acid aminotransferase [Desulforegulaceae bacterium]|nr:branched-chain amino acid aminotransferase [Desulforegulaceae bacterium]